MIPAILLLAPALQDDLSAYAWGETHRRIASARDELSRRLGSLLSRLRPRVAAERPDLLPRLDPAPPAPRPTGYGLLPEIRPDEPESSPPPWEKRYDHPGLSDWTARELGRLGEVEARLEPGTGDLSPAVEGYLRAKENFERIDQHLAYHRFWQPEAKKRPEFFKVRNSLLADYRLWRAPATDEAARAKAEEARLRLEADLLGFAPAKGLAFADAADGRRALAVRVATDVEDEGFLRAFAEGVERTWNGAKAMTEAKVRIDLAWDRRAPRDLYPEGPPDRGGKIDTAKHRERFGAAPFVLTTGADSTNAFAGAIFLGTATTTRRTLAHEFGHLLGFSDGYLRAYEGSPDDPNGAVFFEVGPFPESLMASPGTGRVTEGMVARLLRAYAEDR